MEIIIAIASIIWAILGIVLFFKIWGMTDDVRKILRHLDEFKHQPTQAILNAAATQPKNPQKSNSINNPPSLNIGDYYEVVGFGSCKYEGVFNGNHYFYPVNASHLGKSPYLIDGSEPYLSLPSAEIPNYVSAKV